MNDTNSNQPSPFPQFGEDPVFRCPHCAAQLGIYLRKRTPHGTRTLVSTGNLVITHVDGYCMVCDQPFHFSSTEQLGAEIVARHARRRSDRGD